LLILTGLALLAASPARPAFGQSSGVERFGEKDKGEAPASATSAQSQSPIDIRIDKFGPANLAREGEWTGVQVSVLNRGSAFVSTLVRLDIVDSDGDTAQYQATLTANPGTRQPLWLYARMPYNARSRQFTISAFEAIESGDAGAGSVRPGKLLSRQVVSPGTNAIVSKMTPMIGVVGRQALGLDRLAVPFSTGTTYLPIGHAVTAFAGGLTPGELPDRWMGMAALHTIVWAPAPGEGEPTDLNESQASALREWVRRGGHLVIVVPSVGQTWLSPSNPLGEILPKCKIVRNEGVDLNDFKRLLVGKDVALPSSAVVHTFEPLAGVAPGDADRILSGTRERCVVVRRQVGVGCVTMIGIDLTSRALTSLDAIQADIFWARVLGRRGALLSSAERDKQQLAGEQFPERQNLALDTDMAEQINHTGASAIGVLLAFVVFVLYWLVAGLVGFWVLKQRKATHHAWVAFVASIALFTGIAWGGATLIKPSSYEAKHFTICDYVYGQNTLRARMWASALLPTYRDVPMALRDTDARFNSALAPWETPSENSGDNPIYNDARGYTIDARAPRGMNVPARSTVKSLQADWAGPSSSEWKMPLPVRQPTDGPDQTPALKLTYNAIPIEGKRFKLDGVLKNDMAFDLTDVRVLVVTRQTVPVQTPTLPNVVPEFQRNRLPCEVAGVQLTSAWKAGANLDVGALVDQVAGARGGTTAGVEDLLKRLPGAASGFTGRMVTEIATARFEDRMLASAFYGMLEPPSKGNQPQGFWQRASTHGLDLSRWFTQPCVIVVGWVRNAPSPVPLTRDGEAMKTDGLTMVRWIYPLPDSPPELE
jgi:hypothetical protein